MNHPTKFQAYAIGAGWIPIAVGLAQVCEANGGTVVQVKEKFGGLRFYYARPDGVLEKDEGPEVEFWERFEKLVTAAESMCWRICEETGKVGILHTTGYWLKTVSVEVAAERGLRPVRTRDLEWTEEADAAGE